MLKAFLFAWLLPAAVAVSQQHLPANQEPAVDAPYVLHVYTNLVQLPTLVLSEDFNPMPPMPLQRFELSLDAGPHFHPTQMHIEGDEPIALGLLLDATGDQEAIYKRLPAAMAALVPESLHSVDRVSVYAFDCKLIRSLGNGTPGEDDLGAAVERVLAAPTLHSQVPHHGCKQLALLDAVAAVSQSLAQQPGRRVLLVLGDGHKMDGALRFADVMDAVAGQSIAVFGLRDAQRYAADYGPSGATPSAGRGPRLQAPADPVSSPEDLYDLLCEQSGGLLTGIGVKDIGHQLQRALAMVRGRYILEFPRPNEDRPGKHLVDVTLSHTRAYIRPAGLTMPPPIVPDANAMPPQRSPAVYGKRHPLQAPQF